MIIHGWFKAKLGGGKKARARHSSLSTPWRYGNSIALTIQEHDENDAAVTLNTLDLTLSLDEAREFAREINQAVNSKERP